MGTQSGSGYVTLIPFTAAGLKTGIFGSDTSRSLRQSSVTGFLTSLKARKKKILQGKGQAASRVQEIKKRLKHAER